MNYPTCPRCNVGRMVPMLLSGPACSEACERRAAAPETAQTTLYWATGNEVSTCIWSDKESAVRWAGKCSCAYFQVRWTAADKPEWTTDGLSAWQDMRGSSYALARLKPISAEEEV